MDEFDIIARYFRPLAGREGLALVDDAACLQVGPDEDLIVTKDMLAADVHFRSSDAAADIAWKALAVNVSDLNAKGATPWVYFLGLGLSGDEDEAWLEAFANGLRDAQDRFHITLAGGDTIKTPGRTTLSITAMGRVERGKMIRRSGAQVGDRVYVTGTLGDAALGLERQDGPLAEAYLRPTPPAHLGPRLAGLVHAAADISDGLVADLGHITKASHVGAEIALWDIPLSKDALSCGLEEEAIRRRAATGGDDYQLVLTCAPAREAELFTLCKDLSVKITHVGEIVAGSGVKVIGADGASIDLGPGGYRH